MARIMHDENQQELVCMLPEEYDELKFDSLSNVNEKFLCDHIRSALQRYHAALNDRKHGGVAAADFVHDVERILNMPWDSSKRDSG